MVCPVRNRLARPLVIVSVVTGIQVLNIIVVRFFVWFWWKLSVMRVDVIAVKGANKELL